MNKNKAPTERSLVVSIISVLNDKMFSVSMQSDSDENVSAGYYIYARLIRHNDRITWAIWKLGEPCGGVFLCYLIKKNKKSSSYIGAYR